MAWFTSLLLRPQLRRGRTLDPLDLMPKILTSAGAGPRTKVEKMRELRTLRKRLNIK